MKQRKSLMELAQEVENMRVAKRDFIVPSKRITTVATYSENTGHGMRMYFGDVSADIGKVAHEHLSSKLGIPKVYYDRMKTEAPFLLADNINLWLGRSGDNRMIRLLGDKARAILSDSYRPIDYDVILSAVLPTILEQGRDLEVVSSEVTERKMYLQVVDKRLTGEVAVGDVVQMGINISSSDVGLGSLHIDPYLYRLVCLNGAIMATAIRKYHVGKRIEADEMGIFSTKTLEMDNEVFMRKVSETVRASFNQIEFQKTLKTLSFTATNKIKYEIPQVIKEVTKKYDFSKAESDSILKNFIAGADISQWGLGNAVTRMANDHDDYDRAIEYQKIGGAIIEMQPQVFAQIGG